MLHTILRITVLFVLLTGCTNQAITKTNITLSPWFVVDDFEGAPTLQDWTNIDAQNDTDPFVANPQVSVIRAEPGTNNHYMLR